MEETTIIDLVQNTAILLVLAVLYEIFWLRNEVSKSLWAKIVSGLILGIVGIILMLTPWTFIPGVIFDARSIMLSISGLFLGPIPTIIAMLITGTFRVMIGGDGMWMGLAVIISSGTIGLLWRQFRTSWRDKNIYIELLAMGVIVHLIMLGCVGLLPSDKIILTLKTLTLPLMLIYAPGTMLLGLFLLREENTYKLKLSLLQEIADRKIAEEAIFQSRKDWEETFDSLTDMITVHDKDYNIIRANKAGKSLLHLPEIEKQMKLKCFSFYHGTKTPPVGCPSCDCFKNGLPGVFEIFEPHLNRFLEIRAIPRFNSDNQLVGMIHAVRDITERKKVDEELYREQYLMNSLMDHLPLHIYFKDLESKFIRINNAHAKSFELNKPNEAIGKSDFDFFTEEHARQAFEDEQEIIQSGKSLIKEERNTWKDRADTWVSTIKLPLMDHEGKIVGTFGISRDITERKLADEELIKALAKAEESDRLKTAFLNNISHEIRTPFNGILGFLSIIQTCDLNDSERDEYIEIINQSADRLMQTINDIVEMSQIQAGQIKLEISETSIKRLTDKLTDRYQSVAESQKLDFTINIDLPDNITSVYTDGKKLKTILSKLIVNALKFTKEGSIFLRIQLSGDYLKFSLIDTGIGISNKQQQIIFEFFNQADVSNTRQFEGLGLGLSISKSYVEMLGGKIWVESTPDKGSTFCFTIPK
jgi:hypothetical protein